GTVEDPDQGTAVVVEPASFGEIVEVEAGVLEFVDDAGRGNGIGAVDGFAVGDLDAEAETGRIDLPLKMPVRLSFGPGVAVLAGIVTPVRDDDFTHGSID